MTEAATKIDRNWTGRRALRGVLVAVSLLAGAVALGCGDGGDDPARPGPEVTRPAQRGPQRTVSVGFSALPYERTTEAYLKVFATAAEYADVVLIQRTPPWEEFLPGAVMSKGTEDTTRLEVALLNQYKDLKLFFALDPMDGAVQRSRIANLPAKVDPEAGFEDEQLRAAVKAYAAYVAVNYKPEYMALGVEVNMMYERSPEQYEAFLKLYQETYDLVKASSPQTKVFPTFQLEDMEGTFGTPHPPKWEVLDDFGGRMDVLALSSYPFLAGIRSTADIRPEYYAQIRARWQGEIIIAETGHPSASVEGEVVTGTEEDQREYLKRVLAEAEKERISLVVWLAPIDPAFPVGGSGGVFRNIGLRKADGASKLGWAVWEEWAVRPLGK